MTPEQTWKALREPYVKDCTNCKYATNHRVCAELKVGYSCVEALSSISKRTQSYWEYDND